METALDHWTRVADLSLALDMILADPELVDRIDPDRIMAAGFSFGGWTALCPWAASLDGSRDMRPIAVSTS